MTEGTLDPRAVEALLFLSPEPLAVDTLTDILEVDREEILTALDRVAERFDATSGLELAQVAGGWALRTRADLEGVCDRLRQRPPEDRLSPAALETLAVVAYLEPVSRPDISRLRGVSVDSTVANLVDRGLLEEAGRGDGAHAMRYRTTRAFQKRFGLADRRDLPPIERFELSGSQAEDLRRTLVDSGHLAPGTVTPDDGDDVVHVLSDAPGAPVADAQEPTDDAVTDAPTLSVVPDDGAENDGATESGDADPGAAAPDPGAGEEDEPDLVSAVPGDIRVSDDRWRTDADNDSPDAGHGAEDTDTDQPDDGDDPAGDTW